MEQERGRMPEYIMSFETDDSGKLINGKRKEEVVRCKECKHWYMDADTGMACEYTQLSQPHDGFCNFAERKKA